ncbi:MAG: hypothetical protein ACSHWW_00385 [Nonlabens sp.]|uniref:hypothetical protein n=1 Tax=Nonlabens sp. TaxID=1888209 RepID=UPI003EF8FE1B
MIFKKFKLPVYLFLIILSISCTDEVMEVDRPEGNILIDIGDSLTAGAGGNGTTMSSVTSQLLGNQWLVKNMGVGGENTLTIGARQGGIPMYMKESIKLPRSGFFVKIPSGLFSVYNDSIVSPLIKGNGGINPCYVDGIKCKLIRRHGNYYIGRTDSSSSEYVTQPNSIINTSLSKETQGIATIFIGQNGDYSTPMDFLNQIDLFVEHKGDENVIIITSHINGTTELVQPIREKYGDKHIDLKEYMSTQAIYDAIDYGLLPDNGTYPTAEDLNGMNNGYAPQSLISNGVHFNSIGYELLGLLRYQRGIELGYW